MMWCRHGWSTFLATACVALLLPAGAAADPPWKISSEDGASVLTLGFLAQPQIETVTTADGEDTSKNLFVRRLRLIFGGRVTDKLTFFIETDSPNLGKHTAAGGKADVSVFLQDVILTYAFRETFQVDAGLVLVPLSHNTGQSAASLLAVDFGPYSFLASDPTASRVGRDYGVQARGYVRGKHLEYRAAVFRGYPDASATAPLRYAGRVVWYPFEADTGFFYAGTTLGARRILAIGAGVDHQNDYTARAVDVYLDQPLRDGDGLTLQLDYIRYDGGTTFTQLPAQHTWLIEAGYYNRRTRLGPFVRASGPVAQPGFSTGTQGARRPCILGLGAPVQPEGRRRPNQSGGLSRTLAGGRARASLLVLRGWVASRPPDLNYVFVIREMKPDPSTPSGPRGANVLRSCPTGTWRRTGGARDRQEELGFDRARLVHRPGRAAGGRLRRNWRAGDVVSIGRGPRLNRGDLPA